MRDHTPGIKQQSVREAVKCFLKCLHNAWVYILMRHAQVGDAELSAEPL